MNIDRYKGGKIYKIVNDVDDEIYVGSTCLSLAKRFYNHKQKAKTRLEQRVYKHLNAIGWENVRIILIEEFPCQSKMELEKRERHFIEELAPSLNKCIPCRTQQEYQQIQKAKYENNKERFIAKQRNYHQKNKESINAMRRTPEYRSKERARYAALKLKRQQEAGNVENNNA